MAEPAVDYSHDRQRYIIGIDPGISGAVAVLAPAIIQITLEYRYNRHYIGTQ